MLLTGKRKTALILFLAFDALVFVALILLFQLSGERQSEMDLRDIGVTVYPEARELRDFRLQDQAGDFFSQADFEGHWNLVFFGFTHCPDICPLTMAELKQFYESLEPGLAPQPRIFLVTVDPRRDDPESMAAYLQNYNEDFIGLSGDPAAIEQLAADLFVGFSEAPAAAMPHEGHAQTDEAAANEEGYLIEHSGHIAVIDPSGDYYAVMRAPHRDRDLLTAYLELTR